MEEQRKLKIYVVANCPSCDHKIYIKALMTPTEVEEIMTEEHIQSNKDKIKAEIIKHQIFANDEEMSNALKQVDDTNVIYDDGDTQQAIEMVLSESIKKNNNESTITKKTEDQEPIKSS